MSGDDPIHEEHLPVGQELLGEQQNTGVHLMDDHVPFKNGGGRLGSPAYFAIFEVTVALVIFVAAVYALRRLIARFKGLVFVAQDNTSEASVCGGWTGGSILDDLEAGPQPALENLGLGVGSDQVEFSSILDGQYSSGSRCGGRCTLSQLIESLRMSSGRETLLSKSDSSESSGADVEAGDFAHTAHAITTRCFLPLDTSDKGSVFPVQRKISFEHHDIKPIPEEEEEEEAEDGEEEEKVGDEEKQEAREDEKPVSMRKTLAKMFSRIKDFRTTLFGMRLCRFCSLVRSTENPDLVWDRELGAGTYGRVSLVLHDLGVFAIKELAEAAGHNERAAAEREMDTILSLGYHENVVMVYAIDSEIDTMPILMEAAVGDMQTAINMSRFSFQEDAKLLHGAARGLAHVHSCGKVHGDIKPSNVLIIPNDTEGGTFTFTAKIADFGFTADEGEMIRTGTIGYGPPELLWQREEARQDMDVFSFGVLMLQAFIRPELVEEHMFAHSLLMTDAEKAALDQIISAYPDDPYVAQALQSLVMERTIADGSFEGTMLVPDRLRSDIPDRNMVCDLLKRCLSSDQAKRPIMQQVVQDLSSLSRESV